MSLVAWLAASGLVSALAGAVVAVLADRYGAGMEDMQEDARRAAAYELADLVDTARRYGLPLVVEPTRKVNGNVVFPLVRPSSWRGTPAYYDGQTRFDENGVPL